MTGERSFLGEVAAATIINDYPLSATKSATVVNPNDDRITLYQYKYGREGAFGDGRWIGIPNSGADTVSYTVAGLDNGAKYEFKVRARNPAGRGPSAALVSATPSAMP